VRLPPNTAFQSDGLAVPILSARMIFAVTSIYGVVLCKAAAECYSLGVATTHEGTSVCRE